jgi:hypothetical protein
VSASSTKAADDARDDDDEYYEPKSPAYEPTSPRYAPTSPTCCGAGVLSPPGPLTPVGYCSITGEPLLG